MKKLITVLLLCPVLSKGQIKSIDLDCSRRYNITTADYLSTIKKNILEITNSDFELVKIPAKTIAENGELHETYQEYFRGVPIEFAIIKLHFREDKLYLINGKYQNAPLDNMPALSENEALAIAKSSVKADEYIWDVYDEQSFPEQLRGNSFLYPGPHAQLTYINDPDDAQNAPILAYKFQILASKPVIDKYVYVNCATGNIVMEMSLIDESWADTRYNGTRTICTRTVSSDAPWRLYETGCPAVGGTIHTWNMNHGSLTATDIAAATEFIDGNDVWTAAEWHNSNKDDAAIEAHWSTEQAYRYWLNKHGRNSIDGLGMDIKNYVHTETSLENAYWSQTFNVMGYGDGHSDFDAFTAPDVVGHELGHGIAQFTAGLFGSGEAGAINEGLADIWGACIENYSGSSGDSWVMADQFTIASGMVGLRSLGNPNSTNVFEPGPDTYGGTNWASPGSGGFTHTNSTIISHWFFLLTQGGLGVNDNMDIYYVNGIGMDKAAQITYRAERLYMTSSTNYTNARANTIQAARDLFGDCSLEVAATIRAWYAVGVGADYPILGIMNISSPVTTTNTYQAVQINGSSTIGSTADVEFRATKEINLTPGFETLWGADFLAVIEPCTIMIASKQGDTKIAESENSAIPTINDVAKSSQIQVYPNPAESQISISYPCSQSGQLEISVKEVSGRVVQTEKVTCNGGSTTTHTVDISKFIPGVYFVELTLNDQHVVKKIVKL